MVEIFVSTEELKQIVNDKCVFLNSDDGFKLMYSAEFKEAQPSNLRELFAKQDKDIKQMHYNAGKADGIANFLMLACDEFKDNDECIEYEPKVRVREKLIKIAEMLKKGI